MNLFTKMFLAGVSMCLLGGISGAYASVGGEQGNGHAILFRSAILGLEFNYSSRWSYTDISESVSFSDKNPSQQAQAFSIRKESYPGVQSSESLFSVLKLTNPEAAWTETEMDGKPGYQSEAGTSGIVYILRAPGDVISFRYRVQITGEKDRDIEWALRSVRFKE